MNIFVLTLGCHKNLVDSEMMLGKLQEKQYHIVDSMDKAELVVINTCAFIDAAKEEAIEEILNAVELKKSGKIHYVVVAGCLSERYSDDLIKEIPEIDAVLGVNEIREIDAIVEYVQKNLKKTTVDHSEKLYSSEDARLLTTYSHSAYIKIAEGCDNRCSFCIIPFIRGKYRSRTIEDIVKEVEHLVSCGVKEFNLIAQDTTEYGKDLYGKPELVKLLNALCDIEGVVWIKLFYTYPHLFSDALLDTIQSQEKICKYIDIPIQHTSNAVLKRMCRKDTGTQTQEKLEKIRKAIPNAVIRTSIIVGFPGETEEEYENLKEFLETFRFDYAGIFKYSQEEGTVAATLPHQIDDETKQERFVELTNLQREISHQKNQGLVGETLPVIVDECVEGEFYQYEGRTQYQALDIDGKVLIISKEKLAIGEIINVTIDEALDYDFVGEVVYDSRK